MQVGTSEQSSMRWQTQGRWTSHGDSWMADTPEYLSAVVESSLSQILQDNVPAKYSLTPRACRGILARAAKRGRNLPPDLEAALRSVAERST
jgi:hypothetical protein